MDHNGGKLTARQRETLVVVLKYNALGYGPKHRYSRMMCTRCVRIGLLQINSRGNYTLTDAGRAALAFS